MSSSDPPIPKGRRPKPPRTRDDDVQDENNVSNMRAARTPFRIEEHVWEDPAAVNDETDDIAPSALRRVAVKQGQHMVTGNRGRVDRQEMEREATEGADWIDHQGLEGLQKIIDKATTLRDRVTATERARAAVIVDPADDGEVAEQAAVLAREWGPPPPPAAQGVPPIVRVNPSDDYHEGMLREAAKPPPVVPSVRVAAGRGAKARVAEAKAIQAHALRDKLAHDTATRYAEELEATRKEVIKMMADQRAEREQLNRDSASLRQTAAILTQVITTAQRNASVPAHNGDDNDDYGDNGGGSDDSDGGGGPTPPPHDRGDTSNACDCARIMRFGRPYYMFQTLGNRPATTANLTEYVVNNPAASPNDRVYASRLIARNTRWAFWKARN